MATPAQMSQWREAVQEALNSLESAERYEYRQREPKRGRRRTDARPRPLEFDAGGFPVSQRAPSFTQRLTRLIGDN
jgi:hypothetical protein